MNGMVGAQRISATHWRWIGWSAAAGLLLLPAVAMQLTDEVAWDGTDFLVFGAMLLIAGLGIELCVRIAGGRLYRAAAVAAIMAAFVLVWLQLAVGIVGR